MKVGFKHIKFLQEGGGMPEEAAPEAASAPQATPEQGGGDPLMQLAQMAMQALQAQDCNAAMQVCEAFVQLVQQAQGGGAPTGPEGPAPEEQGEPVYKAGGRLVRRIK